MKLPTDTRWLSALRFWRWRGRRARRQDAGDMGTAFGLDSITILDDDMRPAPRGAEGSAASTDWQRRLHRRSRL